nr:MAG TPA: hypothetical protein [Caudoviricetes sp.]
MTGIRFRFRRPDGQTDNGGSPRLRVDPGRLSAGVAARRMIFPSSGCSDDGFPILLPSVTGARRMVLL